MCVYLRVFLYVGLYNRVWGLGADVGVGGCRFRCGCAIVHFVHVFVSSYVPNVLCPNRYSHFKLIFQEN